MNPAGYILAAALGLAATPSPALVLGPANSGLRPPGTATKTAGFLLNGAPGEILKVRLWSDPAAAWKAWACARHLPEIACPASGRLADLLASCAPKHARFGKLLAFGNANETWLVQPFQRAVGGAGSLAMRLACPSGAVGCDPAGFPLPPATRNLSSLVISAGKTRPGYYSYRVEHSLEFILDWLGPQLAARGFRTVSRGIDAQGSEVWETRKGGATLVMTLKPDLENGGAWLDVFTDLLPRIRNSPPL